MSMVNQVVRQTYACNGVNKNFAIPFAWYDIPQIIVHLITISDGTRTLLVEGVDYTLNPSYDPLLIVNPDPNDPPPIPTLVVTTLAYANLYQLEVSRATPLTQILDYINNSAFNAEDHEIGMNRIVMMIQELKLYVTDMDTALIEMIEDLEQQIIDGSGIPAGGVEYDLAEKNSATNGDLRWTGPMTAVGYSARYNQNVNLLGIKAMVDWLFNIQYQPPGVSLTASGNSLREKGATVTSTTLTAAITKNSNPITEVRFFRNPSTLLDTQTTGGGIPNGGSSTYGWTGSFSDTTVFRVEVDDGATTQTRTVNFNYVYPYYVGAGASGLNGAAIAGLTKLIINQNNNHAVNITASAGQVLYYAFPASYGDLTSILDPNSFEILGSFTKKTVSITGLDGTAQSYTVYEGNNPLTAGSYANTYKR